MTPNEAELLDVENHYPTDRIPREMKEKSVAENLLDKMSETQSVFLSFNDSHNPHNKHSNVSTRKSWCKPWEYYCLPTAE